MGCCASRTSDNTPPAVLAHSSSRNITAPSTRPSSIPSPRASHASQGNAHPPTSRPDADNRPNTPLKPISPTQRSRLPNTLASPTAKSSSRVQPLTDSTHSTWTRSRLEKEREDWWDTQVTGSEQIWGAIRLVAQHLQAAQLQEAQTMLDVSDCTCPTGLLWRGVYDATGVQYKVPEWVVVEPEGLAEEDGMDDKDLAGDASASAVQETVEDTLADDSGSLIRVKVRTSHDQRDHQVVMRMRDSIATIIEKLKKQAKLDPSLVIRLAYGGRIYEPNDVLEANARWNFANNYILTALVFQSPTEYLDFLFESIVKTLDEMGIPDPNEPTSEHNAGGSETDPLLPRARWSDSGSDDGTSAGCVAFLYGLVRSYWNFQRWNYSSLQ